VEVQSESKDRKRSAFSLFGKKDKDKKEKEKETEKESSAKVAPPAQAQPSPALKSKSKPGQPITKAMPPAKSKAPVAAKSRKLSFSDFDASFSDGGEPSTAAHDFAADDDAIPIELMAKTDRSIFTSATAEPAANQSPSAVAAAEDVLGLGDLDLSSLSPEQLEALRASLESQLGDAAGPMMGAGSVAADTTDAQTPTVPDSTIIQQFSWSDF
jgi:hypothetical protein